LVTALESLAASHPVDDVIVRLAGPVAVEDVTGGGVTVLRIEQEPAQIAGCYMGLVQFLGTEAGDGHRWRVRHFDPATHSFQGAETVVCVPPPIANEDNTFPSTSRQIDASPLNSSGWYVYGAPGRDGLFVVQSWTPRALLRLEPEAVMLGSEAAWRHVRHEAWSDLVAKKGKTTSVLCDPRAADAAAARAGWKAGDRALVLHVYAGIGGKLREPAAKARLYFGHFAFGVAEVIHEPLADELSFAITFYQIYTQNVDGLIAGTLDWSRYMGDRQFGWSGLRPTCNILVKLDELDDKYVVDGKPYSVMDAVERNLETMAARYRIGDGRGATFVAAANNCSQDAGQAFYAAIVEVAELIQTSRNLETWTAANPEQAARLQRVRDLGKALRLKLVGGDARRTDWRYATENLGISENPFKNLLRGLGTWRTLFPRKASDTYAQIFLEHGAALWVLGTYQIGGVEPDIEPIPAWTF
jgi:predicted Abi (CAAX) family protease